MTHIANWCRLNPTVFERQYKDHLSSFHSWDQKDHADKWLVFKNNVSTHLSLDETSISNGELYSILTNKSAKGGRGSIVAMIEGTKSDDISKVFNKIPLTKRLSVEEVTLDFSLSMEKAATFSFPNARITTDRFHVQKLVTEALQEMRISLRWKAIQEENDVVKEAKQTNRQHKPKVYQNGDTKKQLLARSRYLLFKPKSKWTDRQKERAVILFKEFPELEKGYNLSMCFRNIYETSKTREEAEERFGKWFKIVDEKKFDSFVTVANYLMNRLDTILNYFPDRHTNASAESFNAKLKGFRALVRGVTDKKFFLFRVSKIYG